MGDPMTYIPETSTVLEVDWATFKNTCVLNKSLSIQYTEHPNRYDVYTTDALIWHTRVVKGTPDALDFETHFKDSANCRGSLSVILVDTDGKPTVGNFEEVPHPAGTMVASLGTGGTLKPFRIHSVTGACLVVDSGLEPVVLDIGGLSPSSPGTVALTPIGGLANWRDFSVEATLVGTDGTTPTGGILRVFVQCSCDGTNFTDWVCFPM